MSSPYTTDKFLPSRNQCIVDACEKAREDSRAFCEEHYILWTITRETVEHAFGPQHWNDHFREYLVGIQKGQATALHIYPARITAEEHYEMLRAEE